MLIIHISHGGVAMKYQLDDYELCTDSREFRCQGDIKKTEPLCFNLLLYFIENPSRVVSYQELVENVWRGSVVSDSAINSAIHHLRRLMGDDAKNQRYIKTVSGGGYRLVAGFRAVLESEGDTPSMDVLSDKNDMVATGDDGFSNKLARHESSLNTFTTDISYNDKRPVDNLQPTKQPVNERPASSELGTFGSNLALPDKPSIAVLNFDSAQSSEKEALLAAGLCIDINANIARLPHFFTVARASANQLDHKHVSPARIAQCLGVRYLVYGDVRILGNSLQLTLTVTDAIQGCEIWVEQYRQTIDDLAQLQYETVIAVVSAIDSAVEKAEIERSFLIPSEDLSAWEHYHRGLWHIDRPTEQDVILAAENFNRAIAIDPRFCRAHAGLSIIYTNKVFISVERDTSRDLAISAELANKAIGFCEQDPLAHWSFGKVQFLLAQHHQAKSIYNRVLDLSPNYAHGHLAKAVVCAHSGASEAALEHLDTGERLSPYDPLQFAQDSMRAIALVTNNSYALAADYSTRAICSPNAYFMTHAIAAACLQLSGRTQQATSAAAQVMQLQPSFTVAAYQRAFPFVDEAGREPMVKAMVELGLPRA